MRSAGKVVLIGDIDVDLLLGVDVYPEHGADGIVERLNIQVGGGTMNTAIALSRLGIAAAPLVCIGEDAWAAYLMERLASSGVDLQYVCTRPGLTTGMTIIAVTPDGERTMLSYRGANIAFRPEDLNEAALAESDWLHLSAYALLKPPQRDALWRAVEIARGTGTPVSLDLNNEVVMRQPEQVLRILPLLNTCILGRTEVEWLGGEWGFEGGLDRLNAMGVSLAAVKLGSAGCMLVDARQRLSLPAFEIEAVDASGAGDAFSAGIIYACMNGLSLPATAILASALGALTASVHGAGLSMPGEQEVLALLQEQPKQSEGVGELINFLTKDK